MPAAIRPGGGGGRRDRSDEASLPARDEVPDIRDVPTPRIARPGDPNGPGEGSGALDTTTLDAGVRPRRPAEAWRVQSRVPESGRTVIFSRSVLCGRPWTSGESGRRQGSEPRWPPPASSRSGSSSRELQRTGLSALKAPFRAAILLPTAPDSTPPLGGPPADRAAWAPARPARTGSISRQGLPQGCRGTGPSPPSPTIRRLNGTLMFGGYNHSSNSAWGDTWLFANGTWANLTANLSTTPSARWAALMTWDPWNEEMVLFGGRAGSNILGDTWVFNSSGWNQLFPVTAPSARQAQFSVFTADPTLRADYLYGGSYYLVGLIDNDSWTFVNGTWTDVTSAVAGGPPILDYGGWDPPSHDLLGYASTATNCSGTASTVSFNGTAWTVVNATSPPGPVTQGGGLVYDPIDSAMILFGGGYDSAGICAFLSNTWSYNNTAWTELNSNLTHAPFARCCYSVAYDATQKLLVLLGGAETSQAYVGDTWTFPHAPLALNLSSSSVSVGESVAVNFSANVSGGLAPLSLNWSFGDGSANASGATASHAYGTAGNYRVNFTVRDSQGRSINRSLAISVAALLVAGIQASPTYGEAPLRVNFSASAAGGLGPFVYSWTYGDQGVGSGALASHLYRTGGNFTATLTERDGARQTSRATVNISVTGPARRPRFRPGPSSTVGDAPFLVNFTATPSGNESPFSGVWIFGDGSPSSEGLDVSHLYLTPGPFTATVTVSDAAGHEANASVAVLVDAPLRVSASAVRTAGVAPFSVTFAASPSDGTPPFQFDWSFGDGSANGTGTAPVHVYANAGFYTAQLTATDSGGGPSSRASASRSWSPSAPWPRRTSPWGSPRYRSRSPRPWPGGSSPNGSRGRSGTGTPRPPRT